MSSEYKAVVRGSLKLKGHALKSASRKRRRPSGEFEPPTSPPPAAELRGGADKLNYHDASSADQSSEKHHLNTSHSDNVPNDSEARPSEPAVDDEHLTEAERAFQLVRKRRELERSQKRIEVTHRQRMEKFNAHLATLSEHFDIPKVGPG